MAWFTTHNNQTLETESYPDSAMNIPHSFVKKSSLKSNSIANERSMGNLWRMQTAGGAGSYSSEKL